MPIYIAICLGGLGTYVSDLLLREFSESSDLQILQVDDEVNDETQGHAGCGKIEVETTVDPKLLWSKSRFVMTWLVKLAVVENVKDVEDIHAALTAVGATAITAAVTVLRSHAAIDWSSKEFTSEIQRPMASPLHRSNESSPILYRASCIRSGSSHKFTSLDVSRTVGDCVGKIFPPSSWKASMKDYEVRIMSYVLNEKCWCGISLSNVDQQRNKGNLDSEFRHPHTPPDSTAVVGVRPSTASLLISLCEITFGEIVCDPTCGSGTLLIEGKYEWGDKVQFLGGDIDVDLNQMRMSDNNEVQDCGLSLWDCGRLPVRDRVVDVFVCDPPFGVGCGSAKDAVTLLPKLLRECRRCAVEDGRMVMLLAHRVKELRRVTAPGAVGKWNTGWKIVNERRINLGGMLAYIIELVVTVKIENDGDE